MSENATGLVQTAPGEFEFREIPLPEMVPGSALIRVEANGICASDVEAFEGRDLDIAGMGSKRYPRIIGHEIVGVIDRLGPATPARAGLRVGDRVGLNPRIACGSCDSCYSGDPLSCTSWEYPHSTYGFIPTWVQPGLWGGYSTHAYVHPRSVLYPFTPETDPLDATLWNAFAGGIQWALRDGRVRLGSSVLVLGSGQRGLTCALASLTAGASTVVVTGLTRDAHKLALAKDFGVTAAIDIDSEDLYERGRAITDGRGFDTVIDTTPLTQGTLTDAVGLVRRGGRICTVGIKLKDVLVPIDRVTTRGITIVGGRAPSHRSYSEAAAAVQSDRLRPKLQRMRTHTFGFDRLEEAVHTLSGQVPGERAINVVVTPTTG